MPSASLVNHSVARAGAPIRERLAGHGHELPGVVVGVQRELEDTEGVRDHLAVGMYGHRHRGALAAGAHVDRAEPAQGVEHTVRRHEREPFVLMLLPVQDEIRVRRVEANADLVLNGQQHQYERLALMTPDGVLDTLRGLRSIDVGTGGESTAMPVAIHPYSEVISDAFGVLKLTLYADHYTWEFVPMPGETFTDRGSGTCH